MNHEITSTYKASVLPVKIKLTTYYMSFQGKKSQTNKQNPNIKTPQRPLSSYMTPFVPNVYNWLLHYKWISRGQEVFVVSGFFPSYVKTPSNNTCLKALSYPVYVGQYP